MLHKKCSIVLAQAPARSRRATRRRTCPPRPRNRHRARRRTPPPAWSSRAASQPTVSARALAEQRVAGALHARAPAAPGAGRCRRASSRNAAPASARRPSSARSRRRDGRRCRPRRCARACARSARRSARRRCRMPGAPAATRAVAHCGNFGAPRRPPCVGSNAPPIWRRELVELGRPDHDPAGGRAPARQAAPSARRGSARSCRGSSRNSRATSRSTSTKAGRP